MLYVICISSNVAKPVGPGDPPRLGATPRKKAKKAVARFHQIGAGGRWILSQTEQLGAPNSRSGLLGTARALEMAARARLGAAVDHHQQSSIIEIQSSTLQSYRHSQRRAWWWPPVHANPGIGKLVMETDDDKLDISTRKLKRLFASSFQEAIQMTLAPLGHRIES